MPLTKSRDDERALLFIDTTYHIQHIWNDMDFAVCCIYTHVFAVQPRISTFPHLKIILSTEKKNNNK